MRCRGLIALLIWGQSVAAADLGTWGDLWPVKEPDMLTVIMQRLTALEQSGEMGRKMDAFKERVIRNSLRPPAVPGIGRTEKGTVAKLAMRQPFVLFKGLTFQKLCLPGAFRPGDHHNK
nr:hypothetical protein [Escherichia coli]